MDGADEETERDARPPSRWGRLRARLPLPAPWRRRLRNAIGALATLALVALIAVVAANVVVVRAAAGLTVDEPDALPAEEAGAIRVGIVFGALVFPDGTLSGALEDRVEAAVGLYRAGRVSHLLMTGDNSRADYDEVTAMRDRAVAHGVPASAISRDYAGFDTYDSCSRARHQFGVTRAVLVTQDYHLYRALYLCRHQGIDAVGLAVPDWQHHPERLVREYPRDLQVSYTVREWLARVKAVVEAKVTHPRPRFEGPYEGLRGT